MLCFFARIFWTQNETTQVESVIAGQALMLARDGTLYYDLNSYPYTVAAYTPIYYWLEAGLSKAGPPRFLEQRSSDEDHGDKGNKVGQGERLGGEIERPQGPGSDERAQQHSPHAAGCGA